MSDLVDRCFVLDDRADFPKDGGDEPRFCPHSHRPAGHYFPRRIKSTDSRGLFTPARRYRFPIFLKKSIYCSELVYKAVRDATGTQLGKMEKLGSLNWKPHESTIRALENGDPPLDRQMITPVGITRDPKLKLTFVLGYRMDGDSIRYP